MWKVKFLAVGFLLLVFVLAVDSRGRRGRSRRRTPPCRPRACQVSSWSEWSPCTHQCETIGKQKRTRTRTVLESCGGSCPFVLRQTRWCKRVNCQNSATPTGNSHSCQPRDITECVVKLVTGEQIILARAKLNINLEHYTCKIDDGLN